MRILIDYDNIPEAVRRQGSVYVVDRVITAVAGSLTLADNRIDVRFYGGWDSLGALTVRAQKLSAEFQHSFPRIHKITTHSPHLALTVNVALAQAMEVLPGKMLPDTYRLRPPARQLICEDPKAVGCAAATCPLVPMKHVLDCMTCPEPGCPITYEMLVKSRAEQKLVDTMMVADMIHLASKHSEIIVVSSDDDVWPGIISAMLIGTHVIHVETNVTSTSSTTYRTSIPGKYSTVRL